MPMLLPGATLKAEKDECYKSKYKNESTD